MTTRFQLSPETDWQITTWQRRSRLAGAALMGFSLIIGFFQPAEFFHGYLLGYLFVFGIALGSLALLMTQYLTGGAWGVMARRVFEAAAQTLPWLALLFVPVLFGIHSLYPWSHPDLVNASDVLRHRSSYMNGTFFTIRAALYFAVWITLISLLTRWSAQEDAGSPRLDLLERLSAPGLILYVFTLSFAMVDWTESLSVDWYSTMWGFLFVAHQGLSAVCFAIGVLSLLSHREPLSSTFRPSHLHDLGKLLLMFVMLWAYFSFCQFLIVWSGNLASEIPWYLPRMQTSWGWVSTSLIFLQFAVPFCMLLSRRLKRSQVGLGVAVALLLVMRLVDLYWVVMPSSYRHGLHLDILQCSLPLALAAIWVGAFLQQLRKRSLLPLHAPNLEEALQHADS